MRWLLLLLPIAWWLGCHAPPCGPDTCDGCCSTDGECLEGVAHSECGLGGVACAVCSATQVCTSRGCRTPADAGSSDGGCVCVFGCCGPDGQCFAGTSTDACGRRRAACVACASGERCQDFACTSAPCAGCLDSAGQCQSGTADFACGADAGLCLACGVTQSCVGGACQDNVCTSATCAGCCSPTLACVVATDPGHCGKGGAPCQICGAGQACVAGFCQ